MVAFWAARFGPAALLLAPVAWVATEILRAHTLFNFAWCLLGYSQHANLPVIQIARFGAVYAVSFVVAASSAALAYAVVEPRPRPRALRRAWPRRAAGGAPSWPTALWRCARRSAESGRLARRPRAGRDPAGGQVGPGASAGRTSTATWRSPARRRPQGARLVVWPESAVPLLFDRNPAVAAAAARLTARAAASTCSSATTTARTGSRPAPPHLGGREDARPRRATSPSATTRSGWCRSASTCRSSPCSPWAAGLGEGGERGGRLHAGRRSTRSGEVDGHRLGRLHLLRGDLPRPACASSPPRGADLLVNITNDAWYGRTSAPHQHLAMAAFRAVENGKYLVRAANTGISAVVDPRGRVLRAHGALRAPRARARRALRARPDLLRPPRRRLRLGLPGGGGGAHRDGGQPSRGRPPGR